MIYYHYVEHSPCLVLTYYENVATIGGMYWKEDAQERVTSLPHTSITTVK